MSADSNLSKYEEVVREIDDINESRFSIREKYIKLKKVLERYCAEITKEETLQFPSLFSRLVFISQKYNLQKKLEWQLQNIRVTGSYLLKNDNNNISENQYTQTVKLLIIFFRSIFINQNTIEVEEEITELKIDKPKDKIRVQIVAIDNENSLVHCHADSLIDKEVIFRYNVKNINTTFNPTIEKLWLGAQLNLINFIIEVDTNYYIPQFIIIEPDYLIDASSLAECFQNYGSSHLHYFRRKFEIVTNSKYILQGNLSNFFLDELIFSTNPEELNFQEVFLEAFKQSPFEFTSCDDIKQNDDFRLFMANAKTQFENIKRVIIRDFKNNNIDPKLCTLEPSFFCEKYGFQGRLDLLQLPVNKKETIKIVELKSGGLPFPKNDHTKIAQNHEAQTIIYRLIIQSVFNKNARDISSTILYSAAENYGENIRLSASFQSLEKEIINIRNLIVATEHDLYLGDNNSVEQVFYELFNFDNYGKTPQFFVDKLADFKKVIDKTSEVERRYFNRYITFVSRELYLQKVGNDGFESHTGVSSLWTSEYQERLETYDLIPDLTILDIDDSGNDMKIIFLRNSISDFVNFREGEICIVYPKESEIDSVLTNQILKGTIVNISNENILVRFRYKQRNKHFFEKYKLWTIEHDKLDHTYNGMFKSLYSFMTAPISKRKLLLGQQKPKSVSTSVTNITSTDTSPIVAKQNIIINKAISATDYFLIVGPPGTGKTSIFAKRLIQLFYEKPDINILVIAYTNRAVDELCEAINSAFDCSNGLCDKYIRIGTDLSCSEKFKHRLLQKLACQVKSREELRTIMFNTRIYVGTLASITGKPELFSLKKFNVAIIDEASQILEPQIIGLLPLFDKFIMIGDHKQLSTITLQDKEKSKVTDNALNDIELYDCSESYFERLFRVCMKNDWNDALGTLTYQGRMHQDIANFVNNNFYEGILCPINKWQKSPLSDLKTNSSNPLQLLVTQQRIAFLHNKNDNNNSLSDKVNIDEAQLVFSLAKEIIEVYKINDIPFNEKTLGIITPYRNQIALIKYIFEESAIPELKNIMVDTVERFQGSQRDIIIISFCINRPYQLDLFCNLNKEKTVDRKLNVALTRARQQLFLIGNEYILRKNKIYNMLLNSIPSNKY